MPPVRPKVSWYCRGRHGGSWSIADEADVVAWSPDHATGPTEGLLGTVERQQQLVVRCGISRAWGGSVLAVQARLRRTRDPRGGRPVVERVTRSGHRPTTWTAGDDCTTGDLRSRAWHGPETVPQRDRGDDCTTGDPRSKAWDGRETVPQRKRGRRCQEQEKGTDGAGGDLRSKAWYGRETVPQRGHTAWTGVVAWSPDHATGPTEGLLGTVERQQQLVVRCGISRAWGGSVLAVQARLRRTRDPRGGRPVVERVTRFGHRPTTWTAGDDCTTGDLRSNA
jgi:hypothetical protein